MNKKLKVLFVMFVSMGFLVSVLSADTIPPAQAARVILLSLPATPSRPARPTP